MSAEMPFREIWAVDFEFGAPPGGRPEPRCMVARELLSGRLIRLWQHELEAQAGPPFDIGAESLFVSHYASAEIGCFLVLGWPIPARIFDTFVEFRCLMNGLKPPNGFRLLGALVAFGLEGIAVDEKQNMQDLALRGGSYTDEERAALLDYCQSDVDALARLFPALWSAISGRGGNAAQRLGQALLRGRYMAAVARMEFTGVPIDQPLYRRLAACWEPFKEGLIAEVNPAYQVYEGPSFRTGRFEAFLAREEIPWPRLESGSLDLSRETFSMMARRFPELADLKDLRNTLSEMRLNDLAVGPDGRNRTLLSPFRSKTGRNQPSNAKFIFGPSSWIRGLIKPAFGFGLAYVDYSSQEIGIAAALSGDPRLIEA